ncbi:hypothetical protein [Actinomadura sp. NEAU-AAG7]|uniref:hypothetical protein n=1 Tax=Actinomadura sp. NEAU-AAG7 TaxID=2839640 RepID=UPI001BE4947C|nr:hypothetical protein [Actinomadura sp. NEAU-AAG7]MBT2207234.1 hypothetical protein [Actinomadura sp. NEAU-AAG7]
MTSTTKRVPEPDAAPLLIHPIGGGDLGRPPLATTPGPIDFHGSAGDRRPLRKVFDGLAETGTDISGLLIIATTNTHNFSRRPFAEHARHMKELLCSADGLCGRTFARDRLHIVQVAEPTVRHGVDSLKPVLTALAPGECLLTSGAGSYALGAGVLLAGIETGVPMTLLPVDDPSAAYRLRDLIDPHDTLRDWLLRHRFWDELATVDPSNADLWRLLAARQRADISLAEGTVPGMDAGTLTKFRELWPTVQAAFFERLARGEAIDHALLRTWFTQRISKPSRKEDAAVSESARRLLQELARKLSDPERHGGAALIGEARRRLSPIPRTHHAALVGDAQFISLFEDSAKHQAHLAPPEARRLPGSLLANADQWEKADPVPGLVKQRGMTAWPVLGSGDVLVLMCVGKTPEDDPADRDGHAAVHKVMDWASHRCGALARPGRIRLRLLASGETMERARSWVTLARATAPAGSLDAAALGPFSTESGDAAAINAALLAALGEAEPTGRYGSTSLRDVDEVLLVINSGKPVAVNGMVAAGVQWSLNAACPLRVAELGRDRALRTVLNEAGLALCRLGMDARLARLASSAVRRLDTRTAWQLLDTGSPALAAARDTAARLHHDLYGHAAPTTNMDTRREMARRRLELIAHVLADEPWPACYTAVEVLRPGLFDWDAWKSLRQRLTPLARLNAYRNETPYAHLLDRLREEQLGRGTRRPSKKPPAPEAVLEELRRAIDALDRPRSDPGPMLVADYTRLRSQLEELGADAR